MTAVPATKEMMTASLVVLCLSLVHSFTVLPSTGSTGSQLTRHLPVYAQYSGDTTRGLGSLTPEQQKAFVAACSDDDFSTVDMVSADEAMWMRVRGAYPALASLDDDTLAATLNSYITTPPTLSEVLIKTPVGPVLLLNIILYITGFSVCDIPFLPNDTQACIELAARNSGS